MGPVSKLQTETAGSSALLVIAASISSHDHNYKHDPQTYKTVLISLWYFLLSI